MPLDSFPTTQEAELWWQSMNDPAGKWHYFRRHIAPHAGKAAQRVEADFKEWVEGRRGPSSSLDEPLGDLYVRHYSPRFAGAQLEGWRMRLTAVVPLRA